MADSLAADLEVRAMIRVSLPDWDSYILGRHHVLQEQVMPIGELARIEEERWSKGRFPCLQLVVADAVYSKRASYRSAVMSQVRPFADRFSSLTTEEFARLTWLDVHERMTGEKLSSEARPPQHLTPAGRARSICGAVRAFVDQGCARIEEARAWAVDPGTRPGLRRALLAVPGIAHALFEYIRMNLGARTLKLDVHVRRVLARHSGLDPAAPADRFEQYLDQVADELRWNRFQLDQIIWYSENGEGRV